jgi:hypothetical protein
VAGARCTRSILQLNDATDALPGRRMIDDAAAVAIGLVAAGLVACAGERRGAADTANAPATAATPAGIPAAELEAAAREVVAFLRGQAPFERLALADTVVLYVTPEGGGGRAVFTREQLRRPAAWAVRSGGQRYGLAPPPELASLTTRAGRHFACIEHALASRLPELGSLPHAGVKLEPKSGGSCLQSWNVTFVFEPGARPPRLAAVVYDQWEW